MSKIKRLFIIFFIIVAVLVIVFFTGSAVASNQFNKNVAREVEGLFSTVESNRDIVTEADLEGLPHNVQQWLEYSGIIGKEKIVSVRLKQKASMKLGKDEAWMPVEAEQYFTTEAPGFIWSARIKAAPFFHIAGRDKYQDGSGNMLIKGLSLFTLADSEGKEIDQGSMLRYLAEIMWFPSAALEEYITWEAIDQYNAKATMTYGGVTASGIFTFNDIGEAIQFQTERYGEFGGEFSIETWSIPVRDYQAFEGINIPTKGDVSWKLADGDFNWFSFEVKRVEYNVPVPY